MYRTQRTVVTRAAVMTAVSTKLGRKKPEPAFAFKADLARIRGFHGSPGWLHSRILPGGDASCTKRVVVHGRACPRFRCVRGKVQSNFEASVVLKQRLTCGQVTLAAADDHAQA